MIFWQQESRCAHGLATPDSSVLVFIMLQVSQNTTGLHANSKAAPSYSRWDRSPISVKNGSFPNLGATEFGTARIHHRSDGPTPGRLRALLMPFKLYSVV